ncbi:MAG: hypothetical protein QNK05_13040 [Myxococcota bacterium]|nr:hypothetical protein [Myxococcota bacterium]
MDPERVLDVGERGIHLLFETRMITEAFGQDADRLRAAVDGRLPELQAALRRLSELDPLDARSFVAELEAPLRHILILLYFDLLDGRLRKKPVLH